MSDPAISAACFDPQSDTHAVLRSGMGIIFRGESPDIVDEPPELARTGTGWQARSAGALELAFEPIAEEGRLGGSKARLCRVRGRVAQTALDCLGTVTETRRAPVWDELDATRSISAIFDPGHAVTLFARRPRGAGGHGEEELTGWLLEDGVLHELEDVRLSTIYDGDGRQRSAGLELWVPGEDFPRRLAGQARAGLSLALEGLLVHAAVFGWRMEGREGVGAYELTVRDRGGAAA
ncbi:MAG: hypothetical protein AVDCRST_MAG45-314 [uncultured Solirubrobacterales bacterium]|uniref:DUF7064 domain-containing protein n=1 Tax=uncultured Solirubrobacterales bacterium TaxID=768556 RepID=A0A6J4S2S6_9ACTN|nr:MAG: hypothetical protein AVDCRST_MAG45-314 [uncultured Solirubrobacterales bacterium]